MIVHEKDIGIFFDNPLKAKGFEDEHDIAEAAHFDAEAERFLAEEGEKALIVDIHEKMPPRHRAFWRELGDASGLRALDIGCGYGYSACRLASMGAEVVAIDVSPKMCDLTRRASELNNVKIDVRNLSAVDTGFPDDYFDLVVGQVSLHHLPLATAGPEILRILKPGGRVVFLEPVHGYRWSFKLRSKLPVACYESPGGGALRKDELQFLGELFGKIEVRYFRILERLLRFRILRWASPIIYAADKVLVVIPGIKGFASAAVIVLTKEDKKGEF